MKTFRNAMPGMLLVALSACLLLASASTALAAEALGSPADRETRAEKFSAVLDESKQLEAGVDYAPGVLIVRLDGDAKLLDSTVTLKEHIVSMDAMPSASPSSITTAPANSKADALFKLGEIDLVAAGDWLNGKVVITVKVPESMGFEEALRILEADARVLSVSLDHMRRLEHLPENMTYDVSINDPSEVSPHLTWHLNDINAYGAWNYAKAEGDVTVVVLDGGFDLDHPDLVANWNLEDAWDAVNEGSLSDDSSLSNFHGTFVAGIISACTNNGLGMSGVSYNAKVLPINVVAEDGYIYDSDVETAYEYAFELIAAGDDSIKVVNMSFGGEGGLDEDLVADIESAVENHGLTLVASAGNSGSNQAHYPSDNESCISVIAVNRDWQKAWFSNYGSGTDISAPGVDIYSTIANNTYAIYEGTSFAAPIVSGVAALLYAADPDATPQEVFDAITNGAVDLGTTGKDALTAHGLVNAENAIELLLFGVDYIDINTSDWYVVEGYFTYAITHGLMKGYNGTTLFGPDSGITRAEFATVLYRMANPNSLATTDPAYFEDDTTGFTDAVDGEYFTAAINWAKQSGIMMGDSVTNFTTVRPNDSLSRQEAAVMAYRFAELVGASTSIEGMSTPDLPDWDDVEGWAVDAMTWCYHRNVIYGWDNGDGTYSALPLTDVTRSMMTKISTVIHRDVMP